VTNNVEFGQHARVPFFTTRLGVVSFFGSLVQVQVQDVGCGDIYVGSVAEVPGSITHVTGAHAKTDSL
jgi:hypothetical protein